MNTLNELKNDINSEKDILTSSDKIIIQNKSETIFIPLDEIIFIETENRGTTIHCKNKVYTNHQTLSKLEKQLDNNFIKTHKSYIVNKNKIRKIKEVADLSYEVQFIETDKTALMSRYKFKELKKYLNPS